jgi:hypothetical protein
VQGSVGPVVVEELLVLAECAQEMGLVPDQGAVQKFCPAGADPSPHDRVHARHPDPCRHGLYALVGEQSIEGAGVAGVAVPDQVFDVHAGVLEVRGEIAPDLGDPLCGGVGGGAEDPDASGGVFDRVYRSKSHRGLGVLGIAVTQDEA